MTTVNDISDFARILREQPEWADAIRSVLLSRELIELPQRLAEYIAATDRRIEAGQTELREGQAALRAGQARLETALANFTESTNRRLEALDAGQTELQAGQARLETALANFAGSTNRRLEALDASQTELRAGQARLEAGQTELREGQTRLEAGQTELREGQARLDASQTELREGQARLDASQTELREGQARLDASQTELREGQARLETSQMLLEARQARLEAGQDELRIDVAEIRSDVAEIRSDLRPLKGAHARNGAERATRRIARTLNCRQVQLLNDDELHDLLWSDPAAASDISRSDRDSFENADIVILAEHRDTGEMHYIAVEASFTAHTDDTHRAIRNAGFLARFTGQPAHAVVASWYVDPNVESVFAEGQAHWVEIDRRYLEGD